MLIDIKIIRAENIRLKERFETFEKEKNIEYLHKQNNVEKKIDSYIQEISELHANVTTLMLEKE